MIQKTRRGRRVVAEDEVLDQNVQQDDADVEVDPAATELLFEAEDVAELVAEVTGQTVEVTVNDDDTVDFNVGDDTFTVSADGDEELLEASTRVMRGSKKRVAASTRRVSASTQRQAAAKRPMTAKRVGRRVK